MTRHNEVRDAIREWIREQGCDAWIEQNVPKWDRTSATGPDRAVLDVAYQDPHNGETVYLDVSVVAGQVSAADGQDRAILRRERAKHTRYPGAGLIPFVMDIRGKWGREAAAWARGLARTCGISEAGTQLQALRYRVSTVLQRAAAEQILRCGLVAGGRYGS